MTAPARFTQNDLLRAHKATQQAGCREYRIIMDLHTGKLEIVVGDTKGGKDKPVELD